jgi:hypothetical protein
VDAMQSHAHGCLGHRHRGAYGGVSLIARVSQRKKLAILLRKPAERLVQREPLRNPLEAIVKLRFKLVLDNDRVRPGYMSPSFVMSDGSHPRERLVRSPALIAHPPSPQQRLLHDVVGVGGCQGVPPGDLLAARTQVGPVPLTRALSRVIRAVSARNASSHRVITDQHLLWVY